MKGNFIQNMEPQIIESTFAQCRVNCIASGQMEGEMKFYFFSKHVKKKKKKLEILLTIFYILGYHSEIHFFGMPNQQN